MTALVLLTQIGMEAVIRYTFTFWEDGIETLTQTIETGPEKGLRTTPEKKERFESVYTHTQQFCKDNDVKNVLYLTFKTYLYISDADVGMATYSAWQSGVNQATLDRLEAYYALHPDKTPQAVFYDADCVSENSDSMTADQIAQWTQTRFGFLPHPTENGDVWFVR